MTMKILRTTVLVGCWIGINSFPLLHPLSLRPVQDFGRSIDHESRTSVATTFRLWENRRASKHRVALGLFSVNFSGRNDKNGRNKRPEDGKNDNVNDEVVGMSPKSHPLRNSQTGADAGNANEGSDEFSQWMEGLKQWPLYPGTSAVGPGGDNGGNDELEPGGAARKKAAEDAVRSSPRYRGTNPLSNLIDLGSILELAASGEEGSNENGKNGLGKMGGNDAQDNEQVPDDAETYFSSIFTVVDQLFKTVSPAEDEPSGQSTSNLLFNVSTVQDLMGQEEWVDNLPRRIGVFYGDATSKDSSGLTRQTNVGWTADAIVKDATARIEYLVNEASTAFSTSNVTRAIQVFSSQNGVIETITNDMRQAAENIAKDRGLDVQSATDQVRDQVLETTRNAAKMATVANSIFEAGYAYDSTHISRRGPGSLGSPGPSATDLPTSPTRPLFADYASARRVGPSQYNPVVIKGGEMGVLAGAIYEDTESRCQSLGHSLVANGTAADIAWMVTDSLDSTSSYDQYASEQPMMVRSITIRGFDASDETVDRERLLNTICTAQSEPISSTLPEILVHSGLLATAKALYADLKKYIEWTSPNHKIVLNGHSVGGSLSVLILLLMVLEDGADEVRNKVLRVYTHGSPPVAMIANNEKKRKSTILDSSPDLLSCPVLEAFDLPSDIVYGYVQPYDPIVRFLTEYDPLYPLVDDLGEDEVTLYVSGPRRSLRPIARALFQSWGDGWPRFRESWKGTNQLYRSVGVQHLLLPEQIRYLNDRFFSVNIGVPQTEEVVQISSSDLLPALNTTFPLDVFQISLLPQAVRSFLHHFYPAYDTTIASYAAKVKKLQQSQQQKQGRSSTTSTGDSGGSGDGNGTIGLGKHPTATTSSTTTLSSWD